MPQLMHSPTPFASPSSRGIAPYSRQLQDPSASLPSVRLACLAPNGRSVHSFVTRNSIPCIESYRLPLPGTTENEIEAKDGDFPDVVRTPLPERVRSALELFPAVELLSVDVDASAPFSKVGNMRKLPKLCLYSKKDVFLLELGYTPSAVSREVEGRVIAVTEPFERVLLGTSTSTNIIRIRQAPQQHMGYATMCPPECMAMLTLDSSINEYSLSLYHGNDTTTTPVSHATEQIEERTERLTDFCFCQSDTLSLLSSLTVAFLKGSGQVLTATPIVFQGTVVPKGFVVKALEFLDSELKRCQEQSAKWRQYRVAKKYIMDAFPDGGNTPFLTVQAFSEAFRWPVQVQGPNLLAAESDDFETSALAIEPFYADKLVGLAVGHSGEVVEFGVISPSTLVPRFSHESRQDTYDLDEQTKQGASVCRVDLRDEEQADHGVLQAAVGLVRDPIMETVVHYVTPSSIKSISTNTLKITANKVREQASASNALFSPPSKRRDARARTTAWSCFDVSSGQSQGTCVAGAVVSGDVHLGHTMVSLLSTGSMVAINLTEARQLQEMEAMGDGQSRGTPSKGSGTGDATLQQLHETPALTDMIDPLVKDVIQGLSGMSKIVGSATPTNEITPEVLAAAVAVKQRGEKEVLLPLLEIKENVKLRRKELEIMYNNMLSQLTALRATVKKLTERKRQIEAKAAIVKENAITLAQRSASALECSTDLQPTITQAEYDYFKHIKQLNEKLAQYEKVFKERNLKTSALIERQPLGHRDVDPQMVRQMNAVLKGVEGKLRGQKQKIRAMEDRVDDLNLAVGIDSVSIMGSVE